MTVARAIPILLMMAISVTMAKDLFVAATAMSAFSVVVVRVLESCGPEMQSESYCKGLWDNHLRADKGKGSRCSGVGIINQSKSLVYHISPIHRNHCTIIRKGRLASFNV